MFDSLIARLRRFGAYPKPIIICTVLTVLSAWWLALFSLGAFAALGMPFFLVVGLPMQVCVIAMGIYLMARLQRNRPESFIKSVPQAVRIIVPLAVALGALQIAQMPGLLPATSPAGNQVRSFDAGVENGVCAAVFNGTERVVETLAYCSSYQSQFNRTFAAAWLLFSSLELWGAWAVYGAEPVRRVEPDRHLFGSAPAARQLSPADYDIRPTNRYLWLTMRLAILLYWIFGGWRAFEDGTTFPILIPIIALLFAALSTRYGIVQAYTSTKRTDPWLLPSWFLNPFKRSQPFQFFHLAGISLLLAGSVGIGRAALDGRQFSFEQWPSGAFAGAFGLGILVGMYWAINAYRSRFQRITFS